MRVDPDQAAAFLREWMDAYSLPYEAFIAARKAIAAKFGLTMNAAKVRWNKHCDSLRKLGLPVPVAPAVPPGLPFGRGQSAAGGGSGGDAVPPTAPPPPVPRKPRKRWNDGESLPPVNPKAPRPAGLQCLPVNAREANGCAFLKGSAETGDLSYCNAPVPKEHRDNPRSLRRNYCEEHAALCVIGPLRKSHGAD